MALRWHLMAILMCIICDISTGPVDHYASTARIFERTHEYEAEKQKQIMYTRLVEHLIHIYLN